MRIEKKMKLNKEKFKTKNEKKNYKRGFFKKIGCKMDGGWKNADREK